jgi:uncharacterized protein
VQNQEIDRTDYNAPLVRDLAQTPAEIFVASPNNPPWNGWSALGVWVASVLFIAIFPILLIVPYVFGQGASILSDQAQLGEFLKSDQTAILLQLIAIIPAHLLTLALAWMVVTRLKTYPFFETLGWQWGGYKVWHSLAIVVFFFAVAIGLTAVFGEVENEFDKMLKSSRAAVYLVAFFATFTAPLVEEVVYRGVLYSAFQRRFGIILAVIFVTVLFTIVHVPQYSLNNVPDYASVITLLLLSLTLTLIRVRTGNLLPCIVLHTVFNGIQSLLLIAQPFLPDLEKQLPDQPAMLIRMLF